jgi:hypothetical protein
MGGSLNIYSSMATRILSGPSGPTAVPESSTLLLIGTGLLGLIGFRRLRK